MSSLSKLQDFLDNEALLGRHACAMSVPIKWLKGDALLKFCYVRNCLYGHRLEQCPTDYTVCIQTEVINDIRTAVEGVVNEQLCLRATKIDSLGGWGVELFHDLSDTHIWIGRTGTRKKALRAISELYYLASK